MASSIGLFVGIIAGVVALIVILSVIVLCCCCKPFKSQQLGYKTGTQQGAAQQPALPTGQSGSITIYRSSVKQHRHTKRHVLLVVQLHSYTMKPVTKGHE